jgi:diguanylate cyclase (GGDEF)-like protein
MLWRVPLPTVRADVLQPLPAEPVPELTRDDVRVALHRALAEALPSICLGLSVVYAVVPVGHLLVLPRPVLAWMMPLAIGSFLLFAGAGLLMRRRGPPSPALAHPVGALLALLLAANSILHMALTGDPKQSTNLSIVVVAMGCVFTSARWMSALCVVFIIAWGAAFARIAGPGDLAHFGFLNFMSAALGFTVLRIHVRLLESNARAAHARDQQALQMQRLSLTDPLTGLANRRAFDAALRREWDRAARNRRSLAAMVIDVDHFKRYNDTFGHLAGDDCLVHVAGVLRVAVRSIDTLGRFGGEEFVVLLPEATEVQALAAAERLRAAVERACSARGAVDAPGGGGVTVSIGVAGLPADSGMEPAALLDAADRALYRAKALGRNRCVAATTTRASEAPGQPATACRGTAV